METHRQPTRNRHAALPFAGAGCRAEPRDRARLFAVIVVFAVTVSRAQAESVKDRFRDAFDARRIRDEVLQATAQREMGGANLPVDPAVRLQVRSARTLIDERRFDEALAVLQRLLEAPLTALTLSPDGVYRSPPAVAEALLAGLPPETLAAYRRMTDPEAVSRLASPLFDVAAADHVATRLFLGSHGDDAALRLAGLALDRGDFGRARDWLRKLRTTYPDPSVDGLAVERRLAAVEAALGDDAAFRGALDALEREQARDPGRPVRMPLAALKAARAAFRRAPPRAVSSTADPARVAADTLLGADRPPRLWRPCRTTDTGFAALHARLQASGIISTNSRAARYRDRFVDSALPAARPLLAGALMYVRTPDTLSCIDRASGARLWRYAHGDDVSRLRRVTSQLGVPFGGDPILLMHAGNRPGHAMTIDGATLYAVTGNMSAYVHRGPEVQAMGDETVLGLRGNTLTALDRFTGAVRWQQGKVPGSDPALRGLRFTCAPVVHRGRLLVLAESGLQHYCVVFDAVTGRRLRSRYLAAGKSPAWPLTGTGGLAANGGGLFVAAGNGVCMRLDPDDGRVLWASTYRQTRKTVHGVPQLFTKGWLDNQLLFHGRLVLLLPADAQAVLAFDRDTGRRVYRVDDDAGLAGIGLSADGDLLVRRRTGVRCYAAGTGDVRWTRTCSERTGPEIMTAATVLIPAGDRIERLRIVDAARLPPLRLACGGGGGGEDDRLGAITAAGNALVSQRIDALVEYEAFEPSPGQALPDDPAGRVALGQRYALSENWADAARAYAAAVVDTNRQAIAPHLSRVLLHLSAEQPRAVEPYLAVADTVCTALPDLAAVRLARCRVRLARREWPSALTAGLEALAHAGGVLLPADADGERTVSVRAAVEGEFRAAAAVNPSLREAMQAFGRQHLQRDGTPSAPWPLLAALLADTEAGLLAALRAVESLAPGRWAEAEALLLEVARFWDDPEARAAAWQRLGDLYAAAGYRVDADGARNMARAARAAPTAAAQQAHWLRLTLPRILSAPPLPSALGEPLWTVGAGRLRADTARAAWPRDWMQTQLLGTSGSTLCAWRLEDGEPAWRLSALSPVSGEMDGSTGAAASRPVFGFVQQDTDGHVLLLNEALHGAACCLRTGRRLWPLPPAPADGAQRASPGAWNTRMGVVGPGMAFGTHVAARGVPAELVAFDLVSGAVRWTLRLRPAGHPVPLGDRVFVFAADTMRLLDRRTGETLARHDDSLDRRSLRTPLGLLALIERPGSGRALGLLDAHDGRLLWAYPVEPDRYPALERYDDERVLLVDAAAAAGGGLTMLDLASGTPRWIWEAGEQTTFDAAVSRDGDHIDLLTRTYDYRSRRLAMRALRLDARSGAVQRETPIRLPRGSPGLTRGFWFDADSDTFMLIWAPDPGKRGLPAAWQAGMWSKLSGRRTGEVPAFARTRLSRQGWRPLPYHRDAHRLLLRVRGNRVLVGTAEGLTAYALPASPATGRDP